MAAHLPIDILRQSALSLEQFVWPDPSPGTGWSDTPVNTRTTSGRLTRAWQVGADGRLSCFWTTKRASGANGPPD